MARACRFLEYSFRLNDDESITFEELESDKLDIAPGDTFMCFVNPDTKEVTMRKFDALNVEQVTYREC